MSDSQKTFVVLLALAIGAFSCSPVKADQQKHKSHKAVPKQVATPPQETPAPSPPPPPTPEQMPAVPAQVTYQNSQLTILARNSTLGDILRAVRKQTGANVDAPSNATQRIVGQFGPGPARDVLASVLDASDFNYVLLGSPANPNALARVIITAKSSAPATPNGGAVAQSAPQPADDNQAPDTSSDDTDQQPPSESFVPQETQQQQDNQSSDEQNSQDQNQSPQKSPEQLLQELQRQQMIQQQQMQQQQQNQGGDSSQQPNQMQQQQR